MRILILTISYAPEQIGVGPYATSTAEALVAAGHEVQVVTAKPYYPQWRIHDGYRGFGYRRERVGPVTVTRCPLYVPAKPSGARRIIHNLSFGLTAAIPQLWTALRFKPDAVMTIAPSLLAAPVALAAARLTGAHSWLHVQDFEVEAAFATGLMSSDSFAARLADRFQRSVMQAFDTCSTISLPMLRKLAGFGVKDDRIVEFRNWTDIDRVKVLSAPSEYRQEWGPLPPKIALYSGNIANKQGIGIIVEAARLLRHRTDILFLICGEGPQKQQLIESAADLPNIRIETLQPMERLGELLGAADVHLLPQLADAADLVLPSKLANMLASGRPVIATARPGTALYAEVESCGAVTPPGEAEPFAREIEAMLDDPERRTRLGKAARERAEQRWSRTAILARFTSDIEGRSAAHRQIRR